MAATRAGAAAPSARTAFFDNHESTPSQAVPAARESSQAATLRGGGSQEPERLSKTPAAPAPWPSAKVAKRLSPQASQATSAPQPVAKAGQPLRQAPPPSASHVAALWQQHKARQQQQQQQHQKLREAQPKLQQQQQVTLDGSWQLYSAAHAAPPPAAAGAHQRAASTSGMTSPQSLSRPHLQEPHQVPGTTVPPSQQPQAGRQSSEGATAPLQDQPGSYRLLGSCDGTAPGGNAGAVPALHRQLSSTHDGVADGVSQAPRTPDGVARRRKHERNASLPAERVQASRQPAVAE